MSKRRVRQASAVAMDLLQAINDDDSDFGEFYSSGNEYKVSDAYDSDESESSSDDEPLAKLKVKIQNNRAKYQQETENSTESSDDDIPLLYLKKQSETEVVQENVVTELNINEIDDPDLAEILQNDMDTCNTTQRTLEYDWTSQEFICPDTTFKDKLEEAPSDQQLKSPYKYFKMLVTDAMIKSVTQQTNSYAMQKEGIHLNTTEKEIEIMIGIYLKMGLVKMPRVRAYWESESRFPPIADKISRNRFEKLTSLVHFCDNLTVTEVQKADKLWKLRPWLDSLRNSFLIIPGEEHQSVDEIMVSFKGKSSIKQYIRGKPNPWGFKIWGRAGASGILYDFDVYQGAYMGKKSSDSLGVGGDVVMKLVSTLDSGKNYKLFADNYFTSIPLVEALKEKSIWYIGTVRANRMKGCQLKSEKDMKREGRGSVDFKVENKSNVVALRWYDNKAVDVVSSFVGAEPVGEVRRWDKKLKRYVIIKRPAIIETYNKFMGGVDLLDSLTSLYKQKMKSRRWYMYLFWHTLIITVVNAWLWYKRQCGLLHLRPMKLCAFINDVATCLVEVNVVRLGRPSLSPPAVPAKRKANKRPYDDCRLDRMGHFPVWETKRGRCKLSGCDGYTFLKCLKCNVYLCLNKDRNCYTTFHM